MKNSKKGEHDGHNINNDTVETRSAVERSSVQDFTPQNSFFLGQFCASLANSQSP